MINLIINGDSHQLEGEASLTHLLEKLELSGKKIAIELNKEIVPRSTYATVGLKNDDRLEIVHFIGGGKG